MWICNTLIVWFWKKQTGGDLPACFDPTFIKLRWMMTRSKNTVQRLAEPCGFLSLYDCLAPCATALFVADWSFKNVKLTPLVSIKWPVKAICLCVYTCRQGTLVDKANPQSLNHLSSGISCCGQLVANVFVLIILALGMASVCEWLYWVNK